MVDAECPFSEVEVYDRDLVLIEHALGCVAVDIEPGPLKIRFRNDAGVAEEIVVIGDSDDSTAGSEGLHLKGPLLAVNSPAPLRHSITWNEAHAEAARRLSQAAVAITGSDAQLLVFIRWRGSDELRREQTRVTLRYPNGAVVAELFTSALREDGDGWSGCSAGVESGTYRLRIAIGESVLEQTVIASAGSQMQLFYMEEPEAIAEPPSAERRPPLGDPAIFVVPISIGFDPISRAARWAEVARWQLALGAPLLLAAELLSRVRDEARAEHNVLLLAAHLAFPPDRVAQDPRVLREFVRELGTHFPSHPDVLALGLLPGASGLVMPTWLRFGYPPMLHASWGLVVGASGEDPTIVPVGSEAAAIAPSIWRGGAWLTWGGDQPGAGRTPVLASVDMTDVEERMRTALDLLPRAARADLARADERGAAMELVSAIADRAELTEVERWLLTYGIAVRDRALRRRRRRREIESLDEHRIDLVQAAGLPSGTLAVSIASLTEKIRITCAPVAESPVPAPSLEPESRQASMVSNTEGRAKRALLIGIDAYVSDNVRDLRGCVNDVRLMRATLVERFGFPPEDVTLLESRRADAPPEPDAPPARVPTQAEIRKAFRELVEETGPDDVVVIHYAGHGAQMTDREGDEAGYYDSTIMPCDSEGWSGDNRDITDDEIQLLLVDLAKRTAYVTLIVDACHSGTITRDTAEELTRGMPTDTRPASELPPSPIPPERLAELRGAGGTRGHRDTRDAAPSGWVPLSTKYVLIAGCRDEQTSKEYTPPEGGGAVKHGALTYFLVRAIEESEPGATYRDVFERAATRVTARYADQHPQIEGARDRVLFGVEDRPPMRHVRVLARAADGRGVTLATGAALGATVGSEYDVYAPGTTSTAQRERRLGRVRVTAVRAATSDAAIVEETAAGAVATDARAFETRHEWGDMKMPVKLRAAAGLDAHAEAMRAAIRESALLDLVDAGSPLAAPIVHLLAERFVATDADPVPQLGPLDAPAWALEGEDGRLLAPRKSLGEANAVLTNLELLARHRNALALDNPVAESRLRGKFGIELLRLQDDGTYGPVPRDAGGRMVLEEGDRLDVRVRSTHDEPAHVNLLDFGLTGAITPLFPPDGATDAIAPGWSFEVRKGQGKQGWLLRMPTGYPFADADGHAAAAEGIETIKLFVTSRPVDFSYLRQEGTRSIEAPPPPSGMGRLFATAMARPGTRDLADDDEPPRVEPGEDWTTASASFVLRRRARAPLDAAGGAVSLGSTSLRAEGVSGEVVMRPGTGEPPRDPLAQALRASGAAVAQTIEIGGTRPAGAATRGAGPAVELEVRDPAPGLGQAVLSADASGALSWHFAPAAGEGDGARSAGPATRRYAIPLAAAPDGEGDAAAARGVVGALGGELVKQALEVVVFPLVDPVLGAVGETFARSWERRHRPYRVRTFTPDNYTSSPADAEIGGDWWAARGARGPALLLVHGTFSRADAAFGDLPREMVGALDARYGGRVLAFDHHTLSDDPATNVDELIARLHLPDGAELDLDVLSHSRGGLVSRMLVERQGALSAGGRRVRVRNVVFVGAPNAGTALADPERIGALVDRFTTLLSAIPSGGAAEVLSGVLTVVKMLAVGAFKGLPGLSVMQAKALAADGAFVRALEAAGRGSGEPGADTRYFALTSNYDPRQAGVRALLANRLVDLFFGAGNDTVVPTDGVWSGAGRGFPVAPERRVVLERADAVAHTAFFASPAVQRRLDEWLRG